MLKQFLLIIIFTISLQAQNVQILKTSYYIDRTNSQTIKDVYAKKGLFKDFNPHNFNLGFKKETLWIYILIHNPHNKKVSNVIRFVYPLHDYINIYKFKKSKIYEKYLTGDLTKFSTRKIKTDRFIIPYTIPPQETREIMFKIDSQSSLNLEMDFLSKNQYLSILNNSNLILGGYYGAVLIMLLYNLILFFIIKARVYLDYVVFHTINFFLQLGLNGLAFEYFYPNTPYLNKIYIPITFALGNYFVIKFVFSFLGLDKSFFTKNGFGNTVIYYFKILSTASLFLLILSFVIEYASIIKSITILSIIIINSLFLLGIYMMIKYRSDSAKFFVIAWSFLIFGVFVEELHNLGVIGSSFISYYGAQIGAFIELTLLSIALAYRYNTVFQKLKQTKTKLKTLNMKLEEKVVQRTEKLDKQNSQLEIENNNKNILLRELYHRVKNNLQIILSLLSFRSKSIKDTEARLAYEESISRIKSLAILHEQLYSSDNLQIISIKEYITTLVKELEKSFQNSNINFRIDCENIHFHLEEAVSLGLIINELVTNSLKYAFNQNQNNKEIKIEMYVDKNDLFALEISDNGKGIDKSNLKDGFGFKLIEFLAVYKLKGNINIENKNGLAHKITFPKGEK